MRFTGVVYRAYQPKWAFSPLSGDGAKKVGGRFNEEGVPALYTSLEMDTAIREFAQGMSPLQPFTMAAIEVDCDHICDLRDETSRRAEGVDLRDLASAWADARDQLETAIANGVSPLPTVPTWEVVRTMRARGYAGILVPSFVDAPRHKGDNLVFWEWGGFPHKVTVIDDNNALPVDQSSWTAGV
ncbi:RES family NAD+ phosphorylase [Agrobacterium tumefaciens]|uniref:RES domain-containing protein n=1 Tax=Agrobacterium tumefaciens TaxID=358 RepID=A0A2L2LI68_AGRTU|nr:RES domain-containing protein [Agrobacterium tumefaciens]AVH44025.1 hypothetical protein At1D1609_39780 [Agrobacterium tumefaciens]NSY97952.1 RES domain-containing protein [Agrobacterium tumefaciens]